MKPISPKTGQHTGDAQDTADCIELVSFDRLLSEAGRDFFNTARGTLCDYDALTPHIAGASMRTVTYAAEQAAEEVR